MQDQNISAREAGLKVFDNCSHERVGAAVLDNWNFPSEIVDIVRSHHSQEASTDYVKIIQLATLIGDPKDAYPHDESLLALVPEWRTILGMTEDSQTSNDG